MQSCRRVSDLTVHTTSWNKICLHQLNLAERVLSFLPCYALDLKDLTALRSQVDGSFFVTLCRSCSPLRPAQLRGWRQFSFFPQVVRCLLWECGYSATVKQASETDGLFLLLFLLSVKDHSHTLFSTMVLKMQKCSKIPTLQWVEALFAFAQWDWLSFH